MHSDHPPPRTSASVAAAGSGAAAGPGAAELGRQFDLHGRRILVYLARRTDLQTAEDLLGETFVTALTRWDTFDPSRQEPLPWLFGIATNLLRRHWRSERRTRRAFARSAPPDALDDGSSAAGDRIDLERAVHAVTRELDRMRPEVRDTVLLHAWAELSYEQIAAATDVPIGTVRSRLNRARAALRTVPAATALLNGALRA